ncbi:hypothetical protein KEM55_002600 [Ascosphaera atra]|nr:hypothetical protein KEM55_002600 [Ascosphaera atra]
MPFVNNDFWDNAFHRRPELGGQSMDMPQVTDRAKHQSIEEVLGSASKLAHAARWLWDEARFRIGEERHYKYATERGLLVLGPPPDSPPPVQETPSSSPNSCFLRRISRARRQRRQKVREPEQAQKATGEAQGEARGEEEEEEDLEALGARAGATPEPSALPMGSAYTDLSPTMTLEKEPSTAPE